MIIPAAPTAAGSPTTPGQLRRVMRALATVHLVFAATSVGLAGVVVHGYLTDTSDDPLAGLALIVAALLVLAALVQVALALPVVLVRRRPRLAAGLAIPAGLWGLVVTTGPASWFLGGAGVLAEVGGMATTLVSLGLAGCGVADLVATARARRDVPAEGGWGTV